MWPVSTRFLETVAGSHRAVARARLVTTVQYGTNPTGTPVPMLSGTVRLLASSDVKAQLQIEVPGDWWDEVQPYGAEFFVERGVSFGDGTEEYVPLGYFPLAEPFQDSAPYGPVSLDCDDRIGRWIEANRIVIPWQIPAGTTHRAVVNRLVNGSSDGIGTWGLYALQGAPAVPIHWDDAGYDPDTATVDTLPLVDDSSYDYAAKLIGTRGCVFRFRPSGELEVVLADPAMESPASYALRAGPGGTLKRWSRKTSSRGGVYNVVRAVGSGTAQTGYRLARITDPTSPMRYNGPFGARIRYLASPLLSNDQEADEAAATLLSKSTGLPTDTQVWTVPMPALQGLDVVSGPTGTGFGTFVLDEVEIPLVGGGETALKARTLNAVAVVETPETPEPTPDPDPGPGPDPDPGGGPTPGGGDPTDGTQTALVRAWGPIIDGDEFAGATINTTKWGLYNGPGHAGNGLRRPSAYSIVDGMMRCHGDSGGTTGGAAFHRGTYGYRIECRARAYRSGGGGGSDYHFVLILWPDSDQWPAGAEYDYWEGNVNSGGADIFMHLPNHTPYRQDHVSLNINPAEFHNYACEWDPVAQTLTQWVDGVQKYRGTGRVAQAPGPMHPTIQLDNFGGSNHYNANMDIKWVRIYERPNA